MKTRLTEMLNIELPIMLAGMGGVSYSDLVTAVSDAGGIGTFGAATMSTELLTSEIIFRTGLTQTYQRIHLSANYWLRFLGIHFWISIERQCGY